MKYQIKFIKFRILLILVTLVLGVLAIVPVDAQSGPMLLEEKGVQLGNDQGFGLQYLGNVVAAPSPLLDFNKSDDEVSERRQSCLGEMCPLLNFGGEQAGPNFMVNLYTDEIKINGWNWSMNSQVTLTIGTTIFVSPANDYGSVSFNLLPYEILPGQIVQMTDGTNTRTHTVTHLKVTKVDLVANLVQGTADPGSEIKVRAIYFDNESYYWRERYVIADSSGNWIADFSGSSDSISFVTADEYDSEGNFTRVNWKLDLEMIYLPLIQN